MAVSKRDYYDVLGLTKQADAKAIRDAFRQLALKYHPDRNKEPGAEDRFKEIAEAYAVLSNPKKRADYDTGGFGSLKDTNPQDLFGGIDFGDLFGGLGFGGGGDLFERFFGRHRDERSSGPQRGANIEVALHIPLERVLTGGEETIRFEHPVTCPVCHGNRTRPGTSARTCETCHGTGKEVKKSQQVGMLFQQIRPCPTCAGTGSLIDDPCSECHGQGQTLKAEQLSVKIPTGVEEGMVLRVAAHGMPSPSAGGQAGDLFVVVNSHPHQRFQREGADLWCTQDVHLVDAVLGTELQLPTLDGKAQVSVPPASQPGTVLRLRGKGLPHFDHAGRGDLLLKLHIVIPAKLLPAERQLYLQLRHLKSSQH